MYLVNLLHRGEPVWTFLCTVHMLYFQLTSKKHVKSIPLMIVCGKYPMWLISGVFFCWGLKTLNTLDKAALHPGHSIFFPDCPRQSGTVGNCVSYFAYPCLCSLVSRSLLCHISPALCQATAEAICKRIGLFEEDESPVGKSFSGRELDDMSQEKQKDACLNAK